jgi:hypothetical protein
MDANKNAVATHDELGPRLRDREMVGSAVLTTLPSKAERRMGMQRPAKHLQNPTPLVHSSGLLVSSAGPFSPPPPAHGSVVDDEDDDGDSPIKRLCDRHGASWEPVT